MVEVVWATVATVVGDPHSVRIGHGELRIQAG